MRTLTGLVVTALLLGTVGSPTYSAFSRTRTHPAATAAKASFNCASRAVGGVGLEGFYRLGEAPGAATASDSSGQGRHGTYHGGVTLGVAPINSNSDPDTAASFESAAQQYVETGVTAPFAGTAPHSVTFWFRPPAAPSGAGVPQVVGELQRDAGGNLVGWGVLHESGQVKMVRYDAGAVVASVGIPVTAAMEGAWQHYGFTYDGATMRAYLNGAPTGSTATTATVPTVASPARIGGLAGAATTEAAGWLRGGVDDVAIWSRALAATELRALGRANCTYINVVDRTPGLLSHWAMDETSGSTLADRAQSAATCSISGVTLGLRAGLHSGSGYSLSGGGSATSNCGQVHAFTGTAPFSVEGWLSMTAWNEPSVIAAKAGRDTGWSLQMLDTQRLSFTRGSVTLLSNVTVPKDSTWRHIVGTYDGATMRLYLDGSPVGSLASNASVPGTTNPFDLLGKGGTDNTSIYNRALTAAEVSSHWEAR